MFTLRKITMKKLIILLFFAAFATTAFAAEVQQGSIPSLRHLALCSYLKSDQPLEALESSGITLTPDDYVSFPPKASTHQGCAKYHPTIRGLLKQYKKTTYTKGRKHLEDMLGQRKCLVTEADCETTEINFHPINLDRLPCMILDLLNLKKLNFYFNDLTTLPDGIDRLTDLEELNLESNCLTALPESIGNLRKLRFLNLGGNPGITYPTSMGKLTSLEMLNLGGNRLAEVPQWVFVLINLKELYLHHNFLTHLPEDFGKLLQLETLNLKSNPGVTTLPLALTALPKLRYMYWSRE